MKDHDTLLRAFAQLRSDHPDSRLVIVGGGPRADQVQRMVADLELEDAVSLLGRRDDVPRLLPAFDVFTLSSRYEGLSIALLEAMRAGISPVVTAVGGLPEVVRDGVDGLLVPPGDAAALASALGSLARDPVRRQLLGAAAHERSQSYGIGPAADFLTADYLDLAQRGRRACAS